MQRVEERAGRGDEWSDPWMRSKSPAGRKRRRKHSYSSGSSYSSSSSSRSSSASSRSSYRSQSRSSHKKRSPRTHKRQVSPSVIVSERKAANERAALMNPPAPRKRAPSPGMYIKFYFIHFLISSLRYDESRCSKSTCTFKSRPIWTN